MKLQLSKFMMVTLLLLIFQLPISAQVNATFAGGGLTDVTKIDELRNSGFNTVIAFTIHIHPDGSLVWNETTMVSDRQFLLPQLKQNIERLKLAPTSVTRFEFCVGSAGSGTFNSVLDFYNNNPSAFNPGGIVYDNFQVLIDNLPVDAINNDDEVTYDVNSSVTITKMWASMGLKNTIAPYTRASSYWGPLVSQVNSEYPGNMDRNYLQCYAGGGSNTPCQSQWNFGIPNIGGRWGGSGQQTPAQVQSTMQGWKNTCGGDGGFMWIYSNFVGSASNYASAISNVYGGSTGGGLGTNIALNKPVNTSSSYGSGFEAAKAVDNNTSTRWASSTGNVQWIYIDLQASYNISDVVLKWEAAYGKDFTIDVSNDASSWTTIKTVTNNTSLTNNLTGLSGTGRYIRMNATAYGPHTLYSLWEFEVYGTASGGGSSTNIALNKPANTSSIFSSGYEANNAFDGNSTTTRWASSTGSSQWIYVDLQATYSINRVVLKWEAAYAKDYKIQISNNASSWTDIRTVTNNASLNNDLTGLSGTGRYVRMNATAYGPHSLYSIYEFEVYGSSSSSKLVNKKTDAINDVSEIKALRLFPNPVKNDFKLVLKGFKKADVIISDLLGKIVYKTSTTNSEISLTKGTTFKTGMYIIRVVDEDSNQYTSKLIIK